MVRFRLLDNGDTMNYSYVLDCGHEVDGADLWRFVDDDGIAWCHGCRRTLEKWTS